MNFRIITVLPRIGTNTIGLHTDCMLLGSCFATHVGARLTQALPAGHVMVNPFGVLYNPLSINRVLRLLAEDRVSTVEAGIFFGTDGMWHNHLFDTSFSSSSRDTCLHKTLESFTTARRQLRTTSMLFLTWGTADAYFLAANPDYVVSNCHKQPEATFVERRLDVDAIATDTITTINQLRSVRPGLKIVLTVSPYRYLKLGLHGSTLSKAALHLAAERVVQTLPNVVYFPAYEIVVDELRDYRFYDADMVHPSAQAIDYVWERFRAWSFDAELQNYADEKLLIGRALGHRPRHSENEINRCFHERTQQRCEAFRKKWRKAVGQEDAGLVIVD